MPECNDHNRRSKNVTIHNLPESSHSSVANSKAHNADLVKDFLAHMNSQVTFSDVRFCRLGKKSRDNESRPLIICLPSETVAVSIFKYFKDEDVPASLLGISISHDRTPRERRYLEHLRTTLKARQEAGEKTLTINS